MLKLSWKFGELKRYPRWVTMLTNSSGFDYVPNEPENIDQYGSFTISSKIMPCQSYPESLVNQNEILMSNHVNELI